MNIPRVEECTCRCFKQLTVKYFRGGGLQKEFNKMFFKELKLGTEQ